MPFGINDDMDDVYDVIGEPESSKEIGMSSTGTMMEYSYESRGFSFYAVPDPDDEDNYKISAIHLTSSQVRTEKDFTIGTPEQEIYSVYGEEDCEYFSGIYRYYSNDGQCMLQFTCDNGVINDILITEISSIL